MYRPMFWRNFSGTMPDIGNPSPSVSRPRPQGGASAIWYNGRMRRIPRLCVAAALVVFAASAAPLPPLPVPAFADTEVAVCRPLELTRPSVRGVDISLSFAGTPSNCVEIAFGRDTDGDGYLSFEETGVRIGWDCGWRFVECVRTGERLEEPASDVVDGTVRTLRWACAVRRRALRGLSVTDGGIPAFPSLAAAPPGWAYDPDWDMVRLSARGAVSPNARFDVEVTATGYAVIFR